MQTHICASDNLLWYAIPEISSTYYVPQQALDIYNIQVYASGFSCQATLCWYKINVPLPTFAYAYGAVIYTGDVLIWMLC